MKETVKKKIIEFGKDLIKQIRNKENPTIVLSTRALSNVNFNENTQTLELGDKTTSRQFFNTAHSKKFIQTIEVANVSKKLVEIDKTTSLRDVFYQVKRTIPGTKVNVVDEQTETDKAIEDLEIITGFSREQLHINANKNGSVSGKVIILDKGDTIDWSKLGSGGWSIPSNVENITFKKVDAQYILYMEKAAVWERLHEDKFWEKNKCIIMSSQGQTTRGIRRLLQRLSEEHNLPIYVLTDYDPWGFYIYSVIKYGSISLAHISDKMAIPQVKFLGIMSKDIGKYGLQKHFIKLSERDIARIKQIANYDWFKDDKRWQKEFNEMKKYKAKAEIQALSARGISFISEKYLPEKIKAKDWIE